MIHWWALLVATLVGLLVLQVWVKAVPSNPLSGLVDMDGESLFEQAVEAELRAWSDVVGTVERSLHPLVARKVESYSRFLDQAGGDWEVARDLYKDSLVDDWEPEEEEPGHWVDTIQEAEAWSEMALPKMGTVRWKKNKQLRDNTGALKRAKGRRKKLKHKTWEGVSL